MLKRVIHLSAVSFLLLSPTLSCSSGGDDGGLTFGSFSTQATFNGSASITADNGEEAEESGTSGDGDGDPGTTGDGDGDPATTGDGDGDPGTTGDGDGDGDGDDTNCPPGEFGCPCDNGQCSAGLACVMGECALGGGDGDGDPTTGGGADPWDPNMCVMPAMPVTITGIAGSTCSAPCAVDLDCPAGPVGTSPACLLVLDGAMDPDHCVLICDPLGDTCSPGATCKDVPNQPGVGVCTYP